MCEVEGAVPMLKSVAIVACEQEELTKRLTQDTRPSCTRSHVLKAKSAESTQTKSAGKTRPTKQPTKQSETWWIQTHRSGLQE